MKRRGVIWKVSIRTSSEAEEGVMEMLQEFFGTPASSYTDVETGDVTVAVYIAGEKRLDRSAAVSKTNRSNVCVYRGVRKIEPSGNANLAAAGALIPPHSRAPAAKSILPTLRKSLQKINQCGLNIGPGEISVQRVRREDWAESWKRHFKPIEIGAALLIKPSWSKRRPKKNQAVVVIDPGLSFGTGQHPTTAFCLRQLVSSLQLAKSSPRNNPKLKTRNPKLSFLDIGTGSGILAITAAKLGYTPIKAFDFDPESVRIAQENARSNGVSRKVNIRREDVTKLPARSRENFDLICANLISTLLIAERRRILSRLKPGGSLVLAGILKDEFASVQAAYEALGMRLIASRIEKEWQSGAFTYQ
jgi:ribosomal protein L11 methyltransferase